MVRQPAPPGSGGRPVPDRVKAQGVLHFVRRAAETCGRVGPFAPEPGAEALLDRSVTLFQQVIRIPRRAMGQGRSELQAEGPRVGPVAVGGDTERAALADEPRRAEEGPRGRRVTGGLPQPDWLVGGR